MTPRPTILSHPTRGVAAVQAEAVAGGFVVRVLRGSHPDRLDADEAFGPFDDAALPAAFAEVVSGLKGEGFQTGAVAAALDLLTAMPRDARRRAMAAGRLFWLAEPAACEPLLMALGEADAEACPLIDALGRCGDARAFAAVRESAGRKLLSRRRSGVEALIHLRDAEGIATATARVRGDLPDAVLEAKGAEAKVAALAEVPPNRQGQAADFLYEFAGLAADPVAAEAALRWAEALTGIDLGNPFAWRYVKSMFKRASLRLDADAFGRLARLIDASRNLARHAHVKSGLTGQPAVTPIFSNATRDYLRRRTWRHLRRLAEHEPARYADHAAAVLAAYQPGDVAAFLRRGDNSPYARNFATDPWTRSPLIGHILHGGDPTLTWQGTRWSTATTRGEQAARRADRRPRAVLPPMPARDASPDDLSAAQLHHMRLAGATFEIEEQSVWQRLRRFVVGGNPPRRVTMTAPPDWDRLERMLQPQQKPAQPPPPEPPARSEAYPELWDARPVAYLRLLAGGRIEAFVRFALDAVQARHSEVVQQASTDQLLAMLDGPVPAVEELAAGELRRRLDADDPPWPLLLRLANDARPDARLVAHDVFRQKPDLWVAQPDRVVALLIGEHAETSDLAAAVLDGALADVPSEVRRDVADRLLAVLRDPPPAPRLELPDGEAAMFADADDPRLDAVARVLVGPLLPEVDAALGETAALLQLIEASPPLAAVGAAVLAIRPDAADLLGIDYLLRMADHDQAEVRGNAMAIVAGAPTLWQDDPVALLEVAEGRWPDARAVAMAILLERVELARLGVDALQALLDSTLPDVRIAAMAAAGRHLNQLDAAELAGRLAEHPSRDVRDFAFGLAAEHLPAGGKSLARLRPLVAASLFDLTPSRPAKKQAFAAVARHGGHDADAARASGELLLPLTKSEVATDAEAAVAALAAIELAQPNVVTGLKVTAIGGAR